MYDTFFTVLKGRLAASAPQRWADLGCGTGAFTHALATVLPASSEIIAIDQVSQTLAPVMGGQTSVHFFRADMALDPLPLNGLQGILMANSLHYIRDKHTFIRKLEPAFSEKKQWLIVEYDTETANLWVPFPLSFKRLQALFSVLGYDKIEKINTRKSVYGGEMYAALITAEH